MATYGTQDKGYGTVNGTYRPPAISTVQEATLRKIMDAPAPTQSAAGAAAALRKAMQRRAGR